MKVTLNVLERLAKYIGNVFCNYTSKVRIYIEDCSVDEYILKYEDDNNITIRITIRENEFLMEYMLEDGTYKLCNAFSIDVIEEIYEFMFIVGIKIKAAEDYIKQQISTERKI